MRATDTLLEVTDLCVDYVGTQGTVRAVDHVSLNLRKGEIFGLAGESGSGKSTFAQAVMRILGPPGIITGGSVCYGSQDLLRMDEEALRAFRWREISMVFQSAMNALNPVLTIGEQLMDTIHAHRAISRAAARDRAVELLELMELSGGLITHYPHQLSGGMRQRVVIAIALALEPPLIIMDEPTTALDVLVQKEILDQLMALKERLGLTILFITHDLPLMLELCDRIGVLYAGRLAEVGPAQRLRAGGASHPYTRGLMAAFPALNGPMNALESIPGAPPSLVSPPPGCRFHPRCALSESICTQTRPCLTPVVPGHLSACHLSEDGR